MCGIAGFLNFHDVPSSLDQPRLDQMGKTLTHRGPDGFGRFYIHPQHQSLTINGKNQKLGSHFSFDGVLGLSHERLSIIDHSENGFQPFVDSHAALALVCNGEIYNYKEIKIDLEKDGYVFKSSSDCEVILPLYEKYGIQGFQRLVGMFAFAIWDHRQKKLVLCRDRFGEKPLFFIHDGQNYGFASEIKALKSLPFFKNEVSPEGVNSYMTYGHVVPPFSWYKNISRVQCGEVVTMSPKGISRQTYWHPRFIQRRSNNFESVLNQFDTLFGTVIEEGSIVDDLTCALPLSGGIDSSLLALHLNHKKRPINKYTIFEDNSDRLRDEFKRAQIIHEQTNGKHFVLGMKQSENDLIENLTLADEPLFFIVDVGLRKTLYERIAKDTKVALIGGAADHVFLNGTRFHGAMHLDRVGGNWIRKILGRSQVYTPDSFAKARHHSLFNLVRGYFNSEDSSSRVENAFGQLIDNWSPPDRTNAMVLMSLCFDRQYIQYLEDLIGMQYGLEVRDPFLNVRLQEWVSSVPLEYLNPEKDQKRYKFDSPKTKYLIRKALELKGQGKINAVLEGKKVNWGGEKDDLKKKALESGLNDPNNHFKDNDFLWDACGLNKNTALREKEIFDQTGKMPPGLGKIAMLNLWTRSHVDAKSPALPTNV